jgi:hypothetical protein
MYAMKEDISNSKVIPFDSGCGFEDELTSLLAAFMSGQRTIFLSTSSLVGT